MKLAELVTRWKEVKNERLTEPEVFSLLRTPGIVGHVKTYITGCFGTTYKTLDVDGVDASGLLEMAREYSNRFSSATRIHTVYQKGGKTRHDISLGSYDTKRVYDKTRRKWVNRETYWVPTCDISFVVEDASKDHSE
jgi:hypothetical protein